LNCEESRQDFGGTF